jgi:hypothetical protein
MNKMIKFASVVAVTVALAQTLQAIPITGGIQFVGGVGLNTGSAGTAAWVTSWNNTKVQNVSGSFIAPSITPVPGAAVVFASGNWNFNTPVGSPIANFWAVGGFTFQLLSSAISTQVAGFVGVAGTGIVSGPSGSGYDPTMLSWTFTTQDPGLGAPLSYSFSASSINSSVPDGGATVMLLGIALSGVALLRKKLAA